MLHRRLGWALCWITLSAAGAAAQDRSSAVGKWLRANAIPLRAPASPLARPFGALESRMANARVFGLGEATHGQHESFELKRRLTMHAIREHGYRLIAYEGSSSSVRASDDYVAGRTDDRRAAIRSLGMLIWAIEENGALFDDLRTWNATHPPDQRVRLIGIDAQDGGAVVARLRTLLAPAAAGLAQRAEALVARAEAATQRMFTGDRADFDAVQKDAARLAVDLRAAALADTSTSSERELRVQELTAHLGMYGSRGGRDKAMAELLLTQLSSEPADARCIVWAHNGHVQKSALRYMGTEELAMGGHLARALGERYYALGFAFGEGEFQANKQGPDGKWGFRRYTVSAAPAGSLDATFARIGVGDFMLDLRAASAEPALQKWLDEGHGQRWWGGYGVPDDADARTRRSSQLMPTIPRADFDGFAFIARTRAATPVDPNLILPAPRKPAKPTG